ncbi:MAG: sialate O-acetylesterase [bacterium]
MKGMLGAVVVGLMCGAAGAAEAKPLKVYILVGQSNMEGPANIKTFDYIGDDLKTAPMLKEMVGPDGKPVVCDQAWISYLTGAKDKNFEITGKLTAGYGTMYGQDPTKPGKCIGPEFTFGLYMSKAVKEPILLIKTAWGGKSLHTDFRPPSAGPYVPTDADLKKQAAKPEKEKERAVATGVYYRYMVDHAKAVLKDIKRVYPGYDAKQGYEIAGFAWLQGFNDLVAGDVYPPKPGSKVRDYTKYGEWLADFIRDVRKDLGAPKMPFVIGVLGVGGLDANEGTKAFRAAMAAPASLPEFKGNVVAVETAPFWSAELGAIDEKRAKIKQRKWELNNKVKDGKMTKEEAEQAGKKFEAELISPKEQALWERGASNAGYHYLGCAKTFALMGKAFAEALAGMDKK